MIPRVCNGCLAASVDAVYGTVPGPDTIHDPATCELEPPIAPTPTPVTTITIRWQGDPEALDAALAYVRVELSCATAHTDDERLQRRRVLTVLDVLCGVELVGCKLPAGLGVARATSGGDGAA